MPRSSFGGGSNSYNRKTHRHFNTWSDGIDGVRALSKLSSCFEPYGVVKFGSLVRVLLMMLINIFAASGPIIMGMDDTIERRKGQKIKAKGIYRDPVRSSHGHFVKVSGLRWVLPDAIS